MSLRSRQFIVCVILGFLLSSSCFVLSVKAAPCAILSVSLPAGTYEGYHSDPWLSECWLLNLTGTTQTFSVRINNTSGSLRSYDTHLVIALNSAGYSNLVSLVVNGTSVPKSAFKSGNPKPYNLWNWPSGDVYPTWFNDTRINVGLIAKKGYKTVVVSVTFSDATGVGMHFDAYGKKVSYKPPSSGYIAHNSLSQDSTVLFNTGAPPPQPPIADFFFEPLYPEIGQTVTFNASESYDPDGYIACYAWDFGDGTPIVVESDPITTHTYTNYGDFTVKLTVTDDDGLTDEKTLPLHVSQHPIASFTISPPDPLMHELVTFDASASTPDGGVLVSYAWDFGDGNTTTESDPIITHVYATYGTYSVTLNVTDSEGKWDTETQTITVENAPIAGFWWTPYYPQRGESVTFDASASTPDGGILLTYAWDFGDGTPIVVEYDTITTHTYSLTGNYLVTLNVTDSEDRWDLDSQTVTVVPRRYFLTVDTDPTGVVTIPGEDWYNESTNVDLTAPDTVAVSTGVRYKFTYWDVDGTPRLGNPITVTMDADHTATAHYILQYYLTVTSPYGTKGGEDWYNTSTTAYATLDTDIVDQLNGTRRVFTHWSGDASGTNYAQSDPILMDEPKTAIANWKKQYYLDLPSNPQGITAPSGSGWYDDGAYAPISTDEYVPGGSRYRFEMWTTEDMSGIVDPYSPSTMVLVDKPKTVTANYIHQYLVTFTYYGLGSDATGALVTVNGTTKMFDGYPYNVWADEGDVLVYVYEDVVSSTITGKRYKLNNVVGPTSPITVTSDVTVNGRYKEQYKITFDKSGVDTDFSGTVVTVDGTDYTLSTAQDFWWDKDSSHTFGFVSMLIVDAGKRYVWISTTGLSTSQSGTIIVTTSGNVIGNYKTQYYLTVSSSGGYGDPTPVSDWYDAGSPITSSVTSPWAGPTGTRYVCTGWTGTGSVPSSGSGTSVSFTLNDASSVTWNWKTQYLLTVLIDPSGLTPVPTRNPLGEAESSNSWWYDSSVGVTLTAQTVAGYTFDKWKVDATFRGEGENPITVTMDAPHTATAYYEEVIPEPLSISINPITKTIYLDDSVLFTSTVNGGTPEYTYQWYLGGSPVPGAESSSWTFTPSATGIYYVYLNVTDSLGETAQSTTAKITVLPRQPVGGYSISFEKQTSASHIVAYAAIATLFGIVIALPKRKRK